MGKQLLLGIDLGTSSCKTVLFNLQGEIITTATREYSTIYKNNWVEQDPLLWIEAMKYTIQELINNANINIKNVAAIGVDSQGSVALPVDKNNNPLRNAMLWTDRRSEKQCNWIDNNIGDKLYEINGNHNDPSNIAPKVLWIRENEPEIYKNTYKFLHANGYLIAELTGNFSLSISDGGLTQLFDTRAGKWSRELIRLHNLDRDKFPEIFECGDVVGNITPNASMTTGLPEGIPVIAGAMDMVASALGAGAVKPGQAYVAAGTVTALGLCLKKPEFDENLHIYHHAIPDHWISAAGVDFGGGGVRWFRDEVLKEKFSFEIYKRLEKEAEETEPGADGLIFLPYMVGQRAPIWDSDVRSVMFGITPETSRGEIARALMEGNAFGLKIIIEIMENRGLEINEIRLAGGCSKVKLWNQIFADITGKKIIIPENQEVAAFGSAILAGIGSGVIENKEKLLNNIKIKDIYLPRPEYFNRYSNMYQLFKQLFNHLREDFHKLGNIKEKWFT